VSKVLPYTLLIILTFSFFAHKVKSQDFSSTLSASLTANVLLGTQLKTAKVGVSIFGTASYKKLATEGGFNFSISPALQKFGIYDRNFSTHLEVFALAGYGKNDNLLGSNIGFVNHLAFYDYETNENFFYGIGGSMEIFRISGELKKFENNNGAFLVRLSKKQNSFSINFSNDAKTPFFAVGSDKGLTSQVLLNFSRIEGKELWGFGVGLNMVTPLADYSRKPDNYINSDDGMSLVYYNTQPFDKLFHMNMFTSFVYQSSKFGFDTKLGMDSPKAGAYFQNLFHDTFALYPRFSWPVEDKAKFYGLLNAQRNYNFRYE